MTNQVIPAEAVEAAAKALWDKEMNAPWSSVAGGFKAPFLRDARAALEAAAPHMLSDYLLTLAADSKVRGDIGKDEGLESWDYLTWKAEQIRATK